MGFSKASAELERGQKEGAEIPGFYCPFLFGPGFNPLRNPAVDRLEGDFLKLTRISINKAPHNSYFNVAKRRLIVNFNADM
jgi:hypothetical protein